MTYPLIKRVTEWEDSYAARWTTINNAGSAYGTGDTSIVVTDASIMAVGDVIKSVGSGECLLVTGIASNTLTVVRAYGETAASATGLANTNKILVVGNANMQGSGAPAEKYNDPTAVYNYTQIFKTAFSATNTLEAMDLYGGSELSRLQAKKAVEHAESIEHAFLFGERKLVTTGSQPVSTTGGILKFLTVADATVATVVQTTTYTSGTQAELDTFFESLFAKGSDRRVWFCSPKIISFVNKLAEAKVQIINPSESTFGLQINQYQTAHGTMQMVMHQGLTQGYDGYSFALDMDNVAYRPLKGRDTKLMTNIQAADEDGRRDMYITECGLELKLPETHGIFYVT